jgi:mRNA interferase HicA
MGLAHAPCLIQACESSSDLGWLFDGLPGLCCRRSPALRLAALMRCLRNATELFSIGTMNSKQLKKWLEQQGATFQPGKGSHLKVFLNGRQSTLPMHGSTELGKGLEAAIKRQLRLK